LSSGDGVRRRKEEGKKGRSVKETEKEVSGREGRRKE